MEDRFIKYSKLYALIFLLLLSVPIMIAIIIAAFYGLSKLVSSSIIDISFGLGVVTLAPALFSMAYVIFLKRTSNHPVAFVRLISKTIFVIGMAISAVVLVLDMGAFFTKFNTDISGYLCYSLAYLAGNVGILFIIAIIQALTTNKELDWMERGK